MSSQEATGKVENKLENEDIRQSCTRWQFFGGAAAKNRSIDYRTKGADSIHEAWRRGLSMERFIFSTCKGRYSPYLRLCVVFAINGADRKMRCHDMLTQSKCSVVDLPIKRVLHINIHHLPLLVSFRSPTTCNRRRDDWLTTRMRQLRSRQLDADDRFQSMEISSSVHFYLSHDDLCARNVWWDPISY